jgi:uncharacterized spore protein YtfJ
MENNVVDILKSIVGELKEIASTETIIGEPITVGKKTIIPVIKIAVGFGAGGGQGSATNRGDGFGGGGGAGAKVEPAAFIIIDEHGVSLLPASKGSFENIINSIPGVVQKIVEMRKDWKEDKKSEG